MPMRMPRILIQVHIPTKNGTQLRKMLRKIFHNQNDIQLGQNSSKFQVLEIVWVISSTGESEVQDCLLLTCDPVGHWHSRRAYQVKKP